MEETKLLEEVYQKETDLKLNDILLINVPLWRIVRYQARLAYINKKTGYIAKSAKNKVIPNRQLKIISGFWKYLKKKDLTVFFPFNRLVNCNGIYLDKFIDPVLDNTDLECDNCVIIDTPNYFGEYNRIHKDITIVNEYRTITMQLLKNLSLIFTPLIFRKKINLLFDKVKDSFLLESYHRKQFDRSVSLFWASYFYYYFWFNLLKPRRVFIVLREGYFPVISVCKKMGIPVAEFQHGITLDKTVTYTGDFNPKIDPDYFLVFGDYWKGPHFGMPLDRIVNIGWAYSDYLHKAISKNAGKNDKKVLVISSPEISDNILDALRVLSEVDCNCSFDIRLHPCELYNETQKQKLQSIPKAQVVDNKTDSALVLPAYKYVVGENSSVIYEALSVGCKVGMLNLCGLRPAIELPGMKENFFVINDANDFFRFVTEESDHSKSKTEFYSKFDRKLFMDFINQKM